MVKIGIIGVGYTIGIANMHAVGYKEFPDAQITAVYDILDGRAQEFIDRNQLADAKACTSVEELFSLCDAVSICTPNYTHVDLSVAALKAGKHVLCEKPFAPTPEACDEAIRVAESTGKVAMIGLCYRDIPGIVYMKQLLDQGMMGKIFFVREEQGGGRIASPKVQLEWRMQEEQSGPGALADFGSHMMDICDYLLADHCGPIRQIQCMEGTYIPEREVIGHPGKMGKVTNDDVACWNCRTEGGTLYSFTASRIGAAFQLEVVGEGGHLTYNGNAPFQLTIQRKDINGGYLGTPEVVSVPENCYGPTGKPMGPSPFQHQFCGEIRQFLDAIQGIKESKLTFRRGQYIQKLIQKAHESAKTNRMVFVDADRV